MKNAYLEAKETLAKAPSQLANQLFGPDLIWVDDQYLSSERRLAIVGQQIDGWEYTLREFNSDWSVDRAVNGTREFDFGSKYHATPFWRFFHQLRRLNNGAGSGTRSAIWTNLVKFVTVERRSVLGSSFETEALELQAGMTKAELEITKPDVVIFTTGPHYDRILTKYWPEASLEPVGPDVRVLARVVHPELPSRSFRCYHPRYLSQGRLWDTTLEKLKLAVGWV